jgi:hypothetical protein
MADQRVWRQDAKKPMTDAEHAQWLETMAGVGESKPTRCGPRPAPHVAGQNEQMAINAASAAARERDKQKSGQSDKK